MSVADNIVEMTHVIIDGITYAITDEKVRENFPPVYVKEEADRVAEELLALQNENTFTFACVSDVHVNYGSEKHEAQSRETAFHAGMAIKRVASQVGIDFMANLGDNLWGTNTDVELAKKEQLICNQAFYDAFHGYPQFRLVGNHDANLHTACIPTTAIYSMNGRYNVFDTTGETKIRGYGYKEFPEYKLRVIVLNTSDYIDNKGGYGMSDEQKLWFMKALDVSDKPDGSYWNILILSHIPLDFPNGDYNTPADIMAILKAYHVGGTVVIDAGMYDYDKKNKATIIGNIHGHVHNFSRGTIVDTNIMRVCTPNTCFYNNGSAGTGADEAYMPNERYDKTAKTAQDTTVTFYTIDLEEKVIYSTNYGAGYDRQISYDGKSLRTRYSVGWNVTGATHTGSDHVYEGDPYIATITADAGYSLDGATVEVKMHNGNYMEDITAEAYSNGEINISEVIGPVTINVAARDLSVTVTHNATNAVINGTTVATEGGSYTATIKADTGYSLDDAVITVMMDGVDVTADVYSNGGIYIPVVTGDIVITISAKDLSVAVTHHTTHATIEGETVAYTGSPYSATVVAEEGYRLTGEGASITVTMNGTDITADAYSDGTITISNVRGPITISVTARALRLVTQDVTNLAGAVRSSLYLTKQDGEWGPLELGNENYSVAVMSSVDNGGGSFSTRENTTVYLIPVPAKAERVTISVDDNTTEKMDLSVYKQSDTDPAMFARIGHTDWVGFGTYEFTEFDIGEADYMQVGIRHNTVTIPWGYKVEEHATVTFSWYE